MKKIDWISQIESDYNFAKEQGFDSIHLIVETNGGEYEIYELEDGLASDTLDSVIYSDIQEIACDLCSVIKSNKYKIIDTRIE